uniref:Uncharacterized protein n=1 Tax=Oryza barthii TaxID=65489 RepID=A0A0D3GSD5_9ORYZ
MPSSSPPPHQPRCRGCSRFAVPLARRPLSKAITGIDDGVSVRRSSGGSARKRRNGVGIHAAGIDDGDVGRGTLLLCLRAEGSGQPARLTTIDNRVLQKAAHNRRALKRKGRERERERSMASTIALKGRPLATLLKQLLADAPSAATGRPVTTPTASGRTKNGRSGMEGTIKFDDGREGGSNFLVTQR